VPNQREEWIENRDESLRFVSDELWSRVKARQELQSQRSGRLVKTGLARRRRAGGGPASKYLLSGLLRCAAWEASFQLCSAIRYGCASHHNGGNTACSVGLTIRRDYIEDKILSCAHTELLNPARLTGFETRYRAASSRPVVDHSRRVAELNREVQNITDAVANGWVSDALATRLRAAEAERARLTATPKQGHELRPVCCRWRAQKSVPN
jgi:hypothetical protein